MKKIFIVLTTIAILFSCKKVTDTERPIVTIYHPTDGAEFNSLDSVYLNFKVEDADLHEVGYAIINKNILDTLYHKPLAHTHENPFLLDKKYLIEVASHTDATLIVLALDHNGNKTETKRNFHIHPAMHE